MADITTEQVWDELDKNLFAVLGMVTANNESRTAGIVYVVRDHKLYVSTDKDAWKVRHIAQNTNVSITVPITKRVPLMPWIKVPAATITFSGTATIHTLDEVDAALAETLFRGLQNKGDIHETSRIIEIRPQKDCITYGVGVSLMGMRDTVNARGRVRIATE
ncbi:MAG: pyridoxamine 5'-phosphate oxidase family protein [Chloroflexi bacterium]|nr:pyridoxamine 5'-phosphate oxidase family protein [Chloroflexota bacterium]